MEISSSFLIENCVFEASSLSHLRVVTFLSKSGNFYDQGGNLVVHNQIAQISVENIFVGEDNHTKSKTTLFSIFLPSFKSKPLIDPEIFRKECVNVSDVVTLLS